MRILALESSCDESAVAVFDDAAGLLAHEIHSQVDPHREIAINTLHPGDRLTCN